MRWPEIEVVTRELRTDPSIRARQLARADISALIGSLAEWHPALTFAEDRRLLTEAFYDDEVALAGEDRVVAHRSAYALLFESEGAAVACIVLQYEPSEEALLGRTSVVNPAFRGRGIGGASIDAQVAIARAIAAKVTYGFVELDNHAQCAAVERAGFLLCGILPDSDRRRVAPGVTRFVPEAIYIKPLVPPETLVWPDQEQLRPQTAALMKLLFDYGAPVELLAPISYSPAPRLDPSVAALLAARPGGTSTWPDVSLLTRQLGLPPSVMWRQLARGDISRIVPLLPAWYPEIATHSQQQLLTPAFYEDSVALAGDDQRIDRRPAYAIVIEQGAEIVGLTYSSCDLERSVLRGEFMVVDPRRRGLGLSKAITSITTLLGRAIEVETVLAWATLRHPYSQHACEHGGARLIGITPASDRHAVAPGVVKHAFEACYAISLVPPDQSYRPPRTAMRANIAALADFVLGPSQEES